MAGYSGTPLVKKIGIRPGHRLALVDAPIGFKKELLDLPADVEFVSADGKAKAAPLDVVLFFMQSRASLEKHLPKLKSRIAQAGMIWAAWPKRTSGVETDLNENIIRDSGLAIGLVDIKVCAINEVWSGLKFVIPVKDRK
ncbi:MAG: hypothetical protein JWN45_1057 [Acidobacteriaceae bacterium]|nr:hypothetical protein [Acidobacteriaceae bacterium]